MTQNKSVEEVVEEAKLAFYKRHANQAYPKRMVSILKSFETEFKQAIQQERQTSQERERKIVEEILKAGVGIDIRNRMWVEVDDIKNIAQKYNITLTNPNKD